MDFEFDPNKSEANKGKHGIDSIEARVLWNDPDIIEIPVRTSDEPRFLVIGKISDKHWSCVITYRSDRIRIISVRRSRKEEVDLYEGYRLRQEIRRRGRRDRIS
jgi:uncharacterized protein